MFECKVSRASIARRLASASPPQLRAAVSYQHRAELDASNPLLNMFVLSHFR